MNRRRFVSSLGLTGALAWLTTHTTFAQQTAGYSAAVPFLSDPSIAGLSDEDRAYLFQVDITATAQYASLLYPQSVAAGDPRINGAVLWTRLEPSLQGGSFPSLTAFQVAADEAFPSVLLEGVATIDPNHDNVVKLPVSHAVLQPFTTYFYRFLHRGVVSRTGQFKTLPSENAALSQLRLGYVVCQDFGNGYYTAYQHLASEDVDFVVHLGDYIYETIGAGFQQNPARVVPPFPSGSTTIPLDVNDYRHLYRTYRSDVNLQAVHERFAMIQLWDDHEFANDSHQDFHPDENTAPNTADTPQPALRQAANQAWAEYSLADVVFDSTKDWESSVQVYRKIAFGGLADLVITDERLYRDGPPCGNQEYGQRYFTLGCPELLDPSRSMLGATQKDWFLGQVTGSRATWKLWANEVMLMPLRLTAIYVNLDQWDGYPAERRQILSAIRQADVKNFVALTGDLHTFLAGYLKTNFANLLEPPMGVELMVGSITSANFAEEISSAIDLSSRPVPAKQMGVPPNLLDPVIRAANPHIQYWDSSTHGYGILTLTPERLTCEFKAVTTIQATDASQVPLKTFTVEAGRARFI